MGSATNLRVRERRVPLPRSETFEVRLTAAKQRGSVPLLAIRLPDLERTAWRRGLRAARRAERRAVAAFETAVARVLRAADLVAHDPGSDVFLCALLAPTRDGNGVPADARAALARITLAMQTALDGDVEGGWTTVEPHGPVPALSRLVERALARGAQERERYAFFSTLGHELRTPLAAIRGYLETLLDEAGDVEERQRFLRIAHRESVRMSRLVDGMFEISLLDLDDRPRARDGGLPAVAFAAVRDATAAAAGMRGTSVTFRAGPALTVALDTDRLTLVVLNLVHNAIAHGHAGGHVCVSLVDEGRYVVCIVDDDGPGVAPDERERIFDLRSRGRTGAAGSGIGLAVVRLMVARAGGQVDVGDAPMGGARFSVRLPRVGAPDATKPVGMEERSPSRTALAVAVMRAVHQRRDAEPKILEDPIAARLLPPGLLEDVLADPERWQGEDRLMLRSHVVARSRFAEERLATAARRGVVQVVILGAGYDTFAYRQPPWAHDLRIVEIDAPATQRAKLARLAAAQIAIPPNVAYLPVDFERTPLGDALPKAIDVTRPTFFSWLGVMMYLEPAAIDAVFRAVRALPRGSEIVFSYAGPRSGDTRLEDNAAAVGEPWLSRSTPDELRAQLTALGFGEIELPTALEVAMRYFAGRHDLPAPPRPSVGAAIV
jgi:methyltransferase (TIGR00027 family)